MLDADRPITKSNQDRLNRSLFAKYLARNMLDRTDPESLVIGIHGGWGVGKTSILNLVLEEIHLASSNMLETEQPIILNFNPWPYSGQKHLTLAFFRELTACIAHQVKLSDPNSLITLLNQYIDFFVPHTPQYDLKSLFTKKELVDPQELKGRLNHTWAQEQRKLIIVIDNITQLQPAEIKEIFQLVKTIADFTNTIFLLAYDEKRIANGKEYIAKVVQLSFAVPKIAPQDLENILFARLRDTLAYVPESAWNKEYWADIYYSSLKYLFTNCRDITRYVNTLNFGYLRIKDLVDPVDYFSLTAIEVFFPEVYLAIRDNKDLFTDLIEHTYLLNAQLQQQEKMRCDEILQRNHKVPREVLLNLLLKLFPRLRRIYQPGTTYYHSELRARNNKRICSPDIFDVYFRLSMPTGYIPQSEFTTLLAQANNHEIFSENLLRLNQDDRILKFLDQLDSAVLEAIPSEHIQNIVCALLNNADLFPDHPASELSLSTPMRVHRILHRLLSRFDSKDERFTLLQTAIADATHSLYIMIHELMEQAHEHLAESSTYLPVEFRDLTPKQLHSLQQLTATRIQAWAHSDRLVEHPKLLPILYAWQLWGNEYDCKNYVKKITGTDRGLLAFLLAVLAEPIDQAILDNKMEPSWEKFLNDIEVFIPPQSLVTHARALFEDLYFEKLREREQLALMIFLYLIKADTTKEIPKTTV